MTGRTLLIICSICLICWVFHELLLAKLDYKFLELQTELKEQRESLHKRTGDILEQQKMFSNHEKIMNFIYKLNPRKHPADNSQMADTVHLEQQKPVSIKSTISSCRNEKSKKSGRYWMQLNGSDPFEVYCEQTFYGGGWIVVQNRFNGSVQFNRTWIEYKNGFGTLDGEFWLGLENIHKITTATINELLIHLEFTNLSGYARYKRFTVGGETDKYKLMAVEYHSGNFYDFLEKLNGMKFSTPDEDNDNDDQRHCTDEFEGGWWFDDCYDSSSYINGHFIPDGIRISKMMIREAKS